MMRILVVILSQEKKKVSSTAGQKMAFTSPFYKARVAAIPAKITKIKQAIAKKNFSLLGQIMEEDCLNMHAVMLTQRPALVYWLPETVRVMQAVRQWRRQGLESYFTVNTGQNVFVFCRPRDEVRLTARLRRLEGVKEVRRDQIGSGAKLL